MERQAEWRVANAAYAEAFAADAAGAGAGGAAEADAQPMDDELPLALQPLAEGNPQVRG